MALLEVQGLTDAHSPLKLSVAPPEELDGRKIVVIGYPARDNRSNEKSSRRYFRPDL